MTDGYPVVLRIEGRRCVVVGGGAVAARKVTSLLEAGGEVVVVAPRTDARIEAAASDGRLRIERRAFGPSDLDGAFIAVAATDRRDINRAVVEAAQARRVLVNVADDPAACDFTVPATVRRGDITIAVSTGGQSPAVARQLRQELEAWLTPERRTILEIVADVRGQLRSQGRQVSGECWQRALEDEDVRRAVAAGDHEAARDRLLDRLTAAGR